MVTREGEDVGRPDSKGCRSEWAGEEENRSATVLSRDLAVKLRRVGRMGAEIVNRVTRKI